MDRYDVIIIGTGAGGGTLAHALAPTGKRILLLERGDYVRREKANWDPRQVNVEGRYQTKETWHDQDGKALHPHTNYCGRRKHQVLRRGALPASARRTSASCATTAACHPPGRSRTRSSSRTTLKAEHLYQVHGTRGEDPTEPHASGPYRHPAVSHEPRIQAPERRPGLAGTEAVPRPAGHPARRARPEDEPVHPLRHLRRVPVPGARQVRCRRCCASSPRSATRT